MNDPAQRPDEELLRLLSSGDPSAYDVLAYRHARGIYDFALRGTQDEEQAVEATLAAFQRVRHAGPGVPGNVDFRTWLYSLALVEVLALSNNPRTSRVSTEDLRFYYTGHDADTELAHLVWQAARSLRTRDYCVLDLTLRRGLTPEEVADAASLTRSNLYASIGRARGAFEETSAASLLFEYGREACSELNQIVQDSPGDAFRPALRHQIIEHSDECDICRTTLARLPAAYRVFIALPDVDVPEGLANRLLGAAPPVESVPAYVEPEAEDAPVAAEPEAQDEPAFPATGELTAPLAFAPLLPPLATGDAQPSPETLPGEPDTAAIPAPPQPEIAPPPSGEPIPTTEEVQPLGEPLEEEAPALLPPQPDESSPAEPAEVEPGPEPAPRRLALFGAPPEGLTSRLPRPPFAAPEPEPEVETAAEPDTPIEADEAEAEPERPEEQAAPAAAVAAASADARPHRPYYHARDEALPPVDRGFSVTRRLGRVGGGLRSQPMLWSYAVIGVAAALAIYLGVAFAASIRGGGSDLGAIPLDAGTGAAVGQVLSCGNQPINLAHGESRVVAFDPEALQGYRIASVDAVPLSTGASDDGLDAIIDGGFAVRFEAARQETMTPRIDQYELHISWARRDQQARSVCPVEVRVTP